MEVPELRPTPDDVEARIAIVRGLLAAHGADAALLRTRRNFAWLTVGGQNHVVAGSEEGSAPIVVDAAGAAVLAPIPEADRLVEEELGDLPLEVERLEWHDPTATDEAVRARGARIVVDDAALEPLLAPLRTRLIDLEHTRMRWLGERLTLVMDDGLERLQPGTPEAEAAAEALHALTADGIRVPVLLAAADDRIERYRHPLPTSAPIRRRFMLVAVAERWGLHVALTGIRELEPPPERIAQRLRAVGTVQEAMIEATVAGTTLGLVFAAAQRAYAAVGFPAEWRLHHQGGLLGYRPRERIATPGDGTVLEPGMAVAWNPSITGAKLEVSLLLASEPAGMLRALTGPERIYAV
jgi:Xaa-Pro aminopeptidase